MHEHTSTCQYGGYTRAPSRMPFPFACILVNMHYVYDARPVPVVQTLKMRGPFRRSHLKHRATPPDKTYHASDHKAF